MAHALFDVLQGRFADGTPLPEPRDATAVMRSVRDHLARLLNARSGALQHLPDYGLPDLPSLYQALPYSVEDLALAVQELISRYEPRLEHVQVRANPHDQHNCVVALEICGILTDGSLGMFKSYFQSGGHARIREAGLRSGHARVL